MSQKKNAIKGLIASLLMAVANAIVNARVGADIYKFLRWISMGAGAVLLASVIVDTLLQFYPGWDEKVRLWVRYAAGTLLAMGLMLGADALLQRPDLVERIEPIYKIVFVALMACQFVCMLDISYHCVHSCNSLQTYADVYTPMWFLFLCSWVIYHQPTLAL